MNKNSKNVANVHTGVFDNKKNKKERGDICKNASNCGAKIKTFDKIKSNLKCPTSNSAITLIVLIITIIVLLILAGVTLNMIMGENGILKKANIASENTKIANVEDIIKTAVLENEVYNKTGDKNAKDDTQLREEIEEKLKNEGYEIKDGTIKIGEKEIKIEEVIKNASQGGTLEGKEDKNKNRTLAGTQTGYSYKNPVIPQGFKAVDVGTATWSYKDSEKTEVAGWNEGLVIEDEIGNQFVWVPVDGASVPYAKWCTLGNNGVTYSSCSDDTSAIPVNEITQIEKYQGFYIARYEAGLTTETTNQSASTNNNANTKAVSKEGTKIWNWIDYNNANTVAQAMINNSETYGNNKSGLVTGTQWDAIMKWYVNEGIKVDKMQDWGSYYNITYTIQGTEEKPALWYNSDSSIWNKSNNNVVHTANSGYCFHASGLNQNGIKKNIADLGGNILEWTAENYSNNRIIRGGGGDYGTVSVTEKYPVSNRDYYAPTITYPVIGFRMVLYVD